MEVAAAINLVALPIGLGLLGFVEPCSMGANLVFVKYLERRSRRSKITAALIFMAARGGFTGLLGVAAALLGTAFVDAQKTFWIVLGTIYLAIGALYIMGRAGPLLRRIGPGLDRLSAARGSAALGLLFGLNIPACAAPLLFAVFGTAAGAGTVLRGFSTLALFGLALSLPLVLAVAVPPVGRGLDRLAGLSTTMPFWTGVVFLLLGLWSIYFGYFVRLEDWV